MLSAGSIWYMVRNLRGDIMPIHSDSIFFFFLIAFVDSLIACVFVNVSVQVVSKDPGWLPRRRLIFPAVHGTMLSSNCSRTWVGRHRDPSYFLLLMALCDIFLQELQREEVICHGKSTQEPSIPLRVVSIPRRIQPCRRSPVPQEIPCRLGHEPRLGAVRPKTLDEHPHVVVQPERLDTRLAWTLWSAPAQQHLAAHGRVVPVEGRAAGVHLCACLISGLPPAVWMYLTSYAMHPKAKMSHRRRSSRASSVAPSGSSHNEMSSGAMYPAVP